MMLENQVSNMRNWLRDQLSPRAMIGAGVLVAMLAVILLGEFARAVDALRDEVEDLSREQRIESSLLTDQSWPVRARDLAANAAAAEAQFWRGETSGIVAARLQGAVEQAARDAELEQIRVQVAPRPTALGEKAVVFELALDARDRRGQFLSLFQRLAEADGELVITRFEWSRRSGAMTVRIEAPAIIAAQTGSQAA